MVYISDLYGTLFPDFLSKLLDIITNFVFDWRIDLDLPIDTKNPVPFNIYDLPQQEKTVLLLIKLEWMVHGSDEGNWFNES